jgi:hypothetical protein
VTIEIAATFLSPLVRVGGLIGHAGLPGLAPFVAIGLFLAGTGAAYGAYVLLQPRPTGGRQGLGIGLGVVAFGCFGVATFVPLMIHASPTLARPSTMARVVILFPRQGEVVGGDPATIGVTLELEGGKIVPFSSLHLVANAGHVHLYLDGKLVAMTTGLGAQISAAPGQHTLRAEFVAIDHRPFNPRVLATVTFQVRP